MNQAKKAIQRGISHTVPTNPNLSFARNSSRCKQSKQQLTNQLSSMGLKHSKNLPNPINRFGHGFSRRVTKDYGYYPTQYGDLEMDDHYSTNRDGFANCYLDDYGYAKSSSELDGLTDSNRIVYQTDGDNYHHIPDIEELEAQELYEQNIMNSDCLDLIGADMDNVEDADDRFKSHNIYNEDVGETSSQSIYDDINRSVIRQNIIGNIDVVEDVDWRGHQSKRSRPLVTSRKLNHSSNRPSILPQSSRQIQNSNFMSFG